MNIILTGYMGTGKTSVAKELHKILGWEVLDIDDLIVKKEKRSIGDIFADSKCGEKYFRDLESSIIKNAASLDNKIISTGGGAVLRSENIKNLKKNGIIICLEASPEIIFDRIKDDSSRPLLKVKNPLSTIKLMLEARKSFYAENHLSIKTDKLTVSEIAKEIKNFMPETIRVNLKENSYNILIDNDYTKIVNWLPEIKGSKILVVTDSNVAKLYLKNLMAALKSKKYSAFEHIIPAGEEHKNLDEINKIWKSCVKHGLDRGSLIIALGGGVVGDMTGFAAATYLRGIRFVQVPTTLLAQVDASIGGKTGIDLEFGKNLVGAFHQPSLVWIDPNFLTTLDDREYKNGLAEVIKYGMIYSEEYWNFFEKNINNILQRDIETIKTMLFMCAKAKAEVVSQDEKESELRKILNFGHTLGHAIETHQNYSDLKHGEAVAVGMAFAAYLAVQKKFCDKSVETKILNLLEKTGFEIKKWKKEIFKSEAVINKIISIMAHDKKMSDGKIDFVLPEKLGKVKIVTLELDDVKKILNDWGTKRT